MLYITNTMTGKKEIFKSRLKNKVALYVCGVTPYDYSHLGHGRCYVSFDVLYRLLKFLGYDVTYCRNFTDIDDKLLNKSTKELGDAARYLELANTFIDAYHVDMQQLNCLEPMHEPRVTNNMDAIIAFIKGLVDKGHAYQVHGDVYFSIATFSSYPQLSKHDLNDLRAGARVDINDLKKDPLDFALWKGEADGEFWKSPWGWGRPGWHIECSALAAKYLGKQIDIHAGGLDLVFPHHENEIAQSEGLHGVPFSNYWMHNGFVQINKEKMSKSLGNFFTLQQIFGQYDPMVIRYYLLNHHYRAPLDFAFEDVDAFQKSYQRIVKVFAPDTSITVTQDDIKNNSVVQKMLTFVLDDLNTVGMFGVLFENLSACTRDEKQRACIKQFLQSVLGLTLVPLPEKEVVITPEIQALIDERESVRAEKNWARADEIRDQLREMGVELQDQKL